MITIARWVDVADPIAAQAAIEAIFFAASGTQMFADDHARAVFKERWLGRYLHHDPDLVLVARDAAGTIIGYLVGSYDDPARAARFADIGFFAAFADLTARYPAQLHVNLAGSARSSGVGSRLVETFVANARTAGLPGVHVVTGRAARNVSFYNRLGFVERGSAPTNTNDIVFLGRDLA